MIEVELNPAGVETDYLRGLQTCFAGWGDRRTYSWSFEREVGAPRADLIVLRKGGALLAGSAVTYRRVTLPRGGEILAGIMTGSWTLPEARGQGCFTRMIQESLSLTAGRGGALLLAFVTGQNASSSQLAKAGSRLFPTSYLSSTPDTPCPPAQRCDFSLETGDEVAEKLFQAVATSRAGTVRFAYPSVEAWASQILQRPSRTEVLSLEGRAWSVIERHGDTDRVQLIAGEAPETGHVECVRALLRRAIDGNRRLFVFSTSPAVQVACERLGMVRTPGYLTALVADVARLGEQLGTSPASPPSNPPLDQPGSPWFLGQWDLQSGDRM